MTGQLMAQSKEKGKLTTKAPPKPPPKTPVKPKGSAPSSVGPGPVWEYTIMALGNSLERQMEQLSRMGEISWELVSVIAPGPPHGGLSLAYLKRPLKL